MTAASRSLFIRCQRKGLGATSHIRRGLGRLRPSRCMKFCRTCSTTKRIIAAKRTTCLPRRCSLRTRPYWICCTINAPLHAPTHSNKVERLNEDREMARLLDKHAAAASDRLVARHTLGAQSTVVLEASRLKSSHLV
jgi:hypothetical protein